MGSKLVCLKKIETVGVVVFCSCCCCLFLIWWLF